jgi:hypothetical protein
MRSRLLETTGQHGHSPQKLSVLPHTTGIQPYFAFIPEVLVVLWMDKYPAER